MFDDLLRRIDQVLSDDPTLPVSACGIMGHDCSLPFVCWLAALISAEETGEDIQWAATPIAYPEPPYQVIPTADDERYSGCCGGDDDDEDYYDDLDLDAAADDDGYGWGDAMRWSPEVESAR